MDLDTSGNALITPCERMAIVPVDCKAHSDGFEWEGIRVEYYPELPPSDIYCAGMDAHLLVYHTRALNGVFHHECADKLTQTRLQTGQLSFIPARADNRWLFGDGTPCALHVMINEDVFEKSVEQHFKQINYCVLRDDFQVTSPTLQALLRLFGMELDNGGLNGSLYAESLATALSLQIVNHFGSPRNTLNIETDSNIVPAYDLINDEYYRSITLNELAKLVGLSRAQFVRRFKQQFGTTPHNYLIKRRIEIAKRKLKSGAYISLAQLAMELGFADQSHFNRHFSAITGVSPTTFYRGYRFNK
ncbi:MAG: helix-turn-helix transcriptional regulator [Desulfobacteraceae bacterium]|nr:helix-turn-helix transcriptional regulator [Desulfobacteraceae bacterium]